ncbi:hypothetical protein ACFZAR_36330 [Streptomyces sp. NPDC008222]|uniref:hypothetical protein n=1 Tax=Streptomyces sp. NPDC008222 TaxID=3364820 RepID=UPI0036E36659
MATSTRTGASNQTPAKTTTTAAPARKPAAKRTPAKKTTAKPALSLLKPDPGLPQRNRPWMTDTQGYATLAARIAGITTPHIRDWHDHRDGTATRRLPDGAFLQYTLATRTLTWQGRCPMGSVHEYEIGSPSATSAARVHTATCTTLHHDLSTVEPLTADELAEWGILHAPTADIRIPGDLETTTKVVPLPVRPRALGDQLTHAYSATDDTQPIPTLPAHAEQPKEHPQP